MKKLISLTFAIAMMLFISNAYSQELNTSSFSKETNESVSKTKSYGYWELTPSAGVIFPVGKFSENFDISGRTGLDLGYRINREVAIYGNVTYNLLSSKAQSGPNASYLSYTVGPRYYFTNPKLKSTLFLEAGLGGYTFTQDEYSTTVEGVTTNFPEEGETRFGVNAGVGGDVFISDNVSLLLKAKYNLIMSGGDQARSFISTDAGVNIRF
ncbi:MAG: outer membrane beta-barrel protein [Ignavibacteriae bacterium]|nr:outer membrane beta-barrel protein [Ignavibacteriota bacterium]